MQRKWKRVAAALGIAAFIVLLLGFLIPGGLIIPVQGASRGDWNPKSFWFSPWGKSGVHRGIDIFAREGTPVLASCSGVVVYAGTDERGGNVVSVLGPKWRVHYYAHLKTVGVANGQILAQGDELGTVGTTGNAAGKPPHLHYSIVTQIPHIWRWNSGKYGFYRMFYLDPGAELSRDGDDA